MLIPFTVRRPSWALPPWAVNKEHGEPQLCLTVTSDDARKELQHAVVRARGRQCLQHVNVDQLLATRTLYVDDSRFAGDRRRPFQCTDTHFHVHAAVMAPLSWMPLRLTVPIAGSA